MSASGSLISVIMPCLNEEETLGACIEKARCFFRESGRAGEIIVADNGSSDASVSIAQKAGARVVGVTEPGYGSAILGGIAVAQGQYLIIGDADDSYDFSNLSLFVDQLDAGYDLVIGNRFRGGIAPGAMPFLHRYLGNPFLSFLGRLFFGRSVGDFHCGLRACRKDAITALHLESSGMEFASEMIVKASNSRLRLAEVPTTLSPDGRSRKSHLRTWRDGWRHLRFLLVFAPVWLFFYPGVLLVGVGVSLMALLSIKPLDLGEIHLSTHANLFSALAILLGFQAIQFWRSSRYLAALTGLELKTEGSEPEQRECGGELERELLVGGVLLLVGFAGLIYTVILWKQTGFGHLDTSKGMSMAIPSVVATVLGVQIILGSFFLEIMSLAERRGAKLWNRGSVK